MSETSAAAAVVVPSRVRSGAGHWLRSYQVMLRFDATSLRIFLPLMVFVQILMGAGMAFMYGFYLGEVSPAIALFIATGVPALALIPIGFVMVPALVGQQRLEDTYDFIWSLPVPRLVAALSTLTVFTLAALPGMVAALVVGAWRYDIALHVTPSIVPAVLLTSVMAASVGFAMAHLIANPRVTNLITNILIFFVLLFSPLVVPIEQFPAWLASLHRGLPFYHMAVVIRAGLSDGLVSGVAISYLVLVAWTVGGWAASAWVVGRRG